MHLPAFTSGDVLISANDCFASFEDLHREFDTFALIDLCSGIDAAVLHDRLYCLGTPPVDENPVLAMLHREGVLIDIAATGLGVIQPDVMMSHPAAKAPATLYTLLEKQQLTMSVPSGVTRETFVDSFTWFMAQLMSVIKTFVIEDRVPIPLVSTSSTAIVVNSHPTVSVEREGYARLEMSLAHRYAELKDLLLRERTRLDGHAQLDIPPLALHVLREADTPEQLGDAVMQARRRFEKMRNYFRDLEALVSSGSVSLREKAIEGAKLRRAMSLLTKTEEMESSPTDLSLSFARTANDVVQVDRLFNDVPIDNLSFGKLIGYLINQIDEARWKFKLRPLHGLKKQYLDMSSQDIGRAVKKHFAHDISIHDRAKLTTFIGLIEASKEFFSKYNIKLNFPDDQLV